jgi:hypothetical protein
MTPRKRAFSSLLLAGSILALGVALSAGFFALGGFGAGELLQFRLRDGTPVTITAVTYGREQRVLGTWWQRYLYQVLPRRSFRDSGCRFVVGNAGIHVHWNCKSRRDLPLRLVLTDNEGHAVIDGSGSSGGDGYRGFAGDWGFQAFPRRAPVLHGELYEQGQTSGPALARFNFPNPAYARCPIWRGKPLPSTKTLSGVSVTLVSLRETPPPSGTRPTPWPRRWLQATVRLQEEGRPTRRWSNRELSVFDATGNECARTFGGRQHGGLLTFDVEPSPAEETLKLRLRLRRDPRVHPKPSQTWTLSALPLPALGKTIPLKRTGMLGGRPIRTVALIGRGGDLPPGFSGMETIIKGTPCLAIRFDAATPHPGGGWDQALSPSLELTDRRGWRERFEAGRLQGRNCYLYPVPLPPGTRRFDARLMYEHEPTAEFIATPVAN